MNTQTSALDSAPCPCGQAQPFARCCGLWLTGQEDKAAPDAETLMRSRYTAYTLRQEPYLLATWHASTRPASLDLASDTEVRWLGLTVKRHENNGADKATVEFVARYKIAGRAYRMHETSRFVREGGRWFYLDGDVRQP